MEIIGLQKLSLLDFPERLSCIVFTAGCNFRCPFCHNAGVVLKTLPLVPQAEIFAFLQKRKGMLEGVCVTGGEPLLQTGLKEFIKKIRGLGYVVKLDTNGSLPDKLTELIADGLIDYIAMDIKNVPEKYDQTTGCRVDYGTVAASAKIIMESGIDYEFRTTLVKEFHTLSDLKAIGESFKGAKRFFLQNFAPCDSLLGSVPLTPFSDQELQDALEILKTYIPAAKAR